VRSSVRAQAILRTPAHNGKLALPTGVRGAEAGVSAAQAQPQPSQPRANGGQPGTYLRQPAGAPRTPHAQPSRPAFAPKHSDDRGKRGQASPEGNTRQRPAI